MATRETLIYVPPSAPFDRALTWAETALGHIVSPAVVQYRSQLDWFWFSRYVQVRQPSDSGVPQGMDLAGPNGSVLRHVKIRFAGEAASVQGFEDEITRCAGTHQCHVVAGDYGFVGDLGGDRFVGEDRHQARREERAELVARFLMSVCELVLHGLVADGTGWRLEQNDNQENPLGSSFESIVHMFGNITGVKIPIALRTPWMRDATWGAVHL